MSELSDLMERFRRGPELVAVVLTGAAGEEVDFRPGPGKWSIRQIVAHLADSETVGAVRLRFILAEDNPTLTAFNQDAWTANLDYAARKPAQSLDTFRRVRSENYELLKSLPESAFARTGTHTERGPVTLRELVDGYAAHAESHARQVKGLREEYKKVKGRN
ncbi:MAG: DinB family protein [Bryobacteraceae bacterium]